jgi:hypothetical protein
MSLPDSIRIALEGEKEAVQYWIDHHTAELAKFNEHLKHVEAKLKGEIAPIEHTVAEEASDVEPVVEEVAPIIEEADPALTPEVEAVETVVKKVATRTKKAAADPAPVDSPVSGE